jgi:anti-anti-sigma factor
VIREGDAVSRELGDAREAKPVPGAAGEVLVVKAVGEIDLLTDGAVRTDVLRTLGERPGALVLDFSEVTFLGSAGIAVLVEAAQAAQRDGVRFAVAAVNRAVVRPLQLAGVADMLNMHSTLAEALEAVRRPDNQG